MIQLKVREWKESVAIENANQIQTMLNCIDNSGAAIVECVKVLRMDRGAKIGAYHLCLKQCPAAGT